MEKLKILSLCDGLGGLKLAFNELGIETEYHAVEIDKHARKLADDNFSDIIRWSDDVTEITEVDIELYGPFDWIAFGSPCQSVSVAGDGSGLDGKSGLLLDCMKVLKWCQNQNPEIKFLIENVKMKKEFLQQFDDLIQSERILINSDLVSAQKRERYYWTNFKVSQPKDRKIFLKDILEPNIPKSYYFEPVNLERITNSRICWDTAMKNNRSQGDRAYNTDSKSPTVPAHRTDSKVNIFEFVDRDKSHYLTSTYHKGVTLKNYIEKSQRQVVFAYSSSSREKGLEHRSNLSGKSNTLTTGDGCSGGLKSATMVADILDKEIFFRRLTVRECARLQTIPEDYSFSGVSKTQAYKAIGNSWTTSVIAHILKYGLGLAQVEEWEYL